METYTYTLVSPPDFTGLAAGIQSSQMTDKSILGFTFHERDMELIVATENTLSEGDQNLLEDEVDACLNSLEEYKQQAVDLIDHNNEELRIAGAPFDGVRIPLYAKWGDEAKANWLGLYSAKSMISYPRKVPTIIAGTQYILQSEAHFDQLYAAIFGYAEWIISSGQAIMEAIRAATTKAEIDAITDPRI